MNKSASSTLSVAHFIKERKKKNPVLGSCFPGGGVITHSREHLQTPVLFGVS